MNLPCFKYAWRRARHHHGIVGSVLAFAVIVATLAAPAWAAPTSAEQALAVVSGWLSLGDAPLDAAMGGQTSGVVAYGDIDGLPAYQRVEKLRQVTETPAIGMVEVVDGAWPSGRSARDDVSGLG